MPSTFIVLILIVLTTAIASGIVSAVVVFSWSCRYYGKSIMFWRDEWDKVRSELARLKGQTWLHTNANPR